MVNGVPCIKVGLYSGYGVDFAVFEINTVEAKDVSMKPHFIMTKSAWISPTEVLAVYNKLRADNPTKNYEAVDPYTFFSLLKQAGGQ